MEHVSIGKICEVLGISLSTAYRWIKSGKLVHDFRTFGLHRRFNLQNIKDKFFKSNVPIQPKVVVYSRVSSYDQKNDLQRQNDKLIKFCISQNFNSIIAISDLGSGLNYKKPGLNKLINLILNNSIDILVINHKDRLLRFGSEIIFKLCDFHKIKVIILEDKILSFEEELTHNVIELMTVFCAKLYGKRSHKNKTIKI